MDWVAFWAKNLSQVAGRSAAACLALAVSAAPVAAGVGDFFEESFPSRMESEWTVSVDSLFMARTDDMRSILMSDVSTGAVAFQNGDLDLGTMVGPMLNITKDFNNGVGIGVRYFSLLDGEDSTNRFSAPGDTFVESFNGVVYSDLVQFNTSYSSELHNFELNLRKQLHQDVTVFVGYRYLQLGENFDISARNTLPQEPPIEFSATDLTNRLHGVQIGAQATLFDWNRLSLDIGGSTGIYNNHVQQTMFLRNSTTDMDPRTIEDNQAAFVNDLNITGSYRIRERLTFRAGLQMMWLTDVALAPEQTQTNNFNTDQFSVDNSSDVFYFGGFTGLQYDF